MQLPWRLQLAYGITRLMIAFNIVSLLVLFPIMFYLIKNYGIYGAGIGWVIFNAGYYLIMPHWMHKFILPEHKWRWFFYDTFAFMLLGWSLLGLAYLVNRTWHNLLFTAVMVIVAFALYALSCYKLYPSIRFFVLDLLQLLTKRKLNARQEF
jgi:O-antigen/teichoic acid export membrane protein